jgi:ribonuclease HI
MQKFYAVKKGFTIGIFSTWKECLNAVSGYNNPEYRLFYTEEEALAFINEAEPVKA